MSDKFFKLERLENCARCGGIHEDLLFKKFEISPDDPYLYWCSCPSNGDPILLAKQAWISVGADLKGSFDPEAPRSELIKQIRNLTIELQDRAVYTGNVAFHQNWIGAKEQVQAIDNVSNLLKLLLSKLEEKDE